MAGKSVSGYVDEAVAERLASVARAEARTPASLVGQAIGFYTGLPEAARTALRRMDHHATPDERRWLMGELVRLFIRADFSLTQRLMAEEAHASLPEGTSEKEIEAAASDWTTAKRP